MEAMRALLAGITTLDVVHLLDHPLDPVTKTTSTDHMLAAGGPAANAALTIAALQRLEPAASAAVADDTPAGKPADTAIDLLTTLGTGPVAHVLTEELTAAGVTPLDATAPGFEGEPAISSAIEHPDGRHVSSTDGRVPVDVAKAEAGLARALVNDGMPRTVLVDGHNPELAQLALRVGLPELDPDDPFAEADAHPAHLRVYDGGSWRPWIPPLLPLIDVAMVSADYHPPMVAGFDGLVDFMAGFGVDRVILTDGPGQVRYSWAGSRGTVDVTPRRAISTMGAGDIVHGALAWGLSFIDEGGTDLSDPSRLISMACEVAGIATETFGTRAWMDDTRIADVVGEWLAG